MNYFSQIGKSFNRIIGRFTNIFLVRIVFYYFVVLLFASLFLMAPWIWKGDKTINFFDSLYMATSAISTTGLTVYDISEEMTFGGQLIIFGLIFAGGFGLIFFKVKIFEGIRWLFKRWGDRYMDTHEQYFERGYFNPQISESVLRVGFVCLLTSYILGFFFLVTYFLLVPIENLNYQKEPWKAVWSATFHSVSATNNAGFDIIADGEKFNSLEVLQGHYFVQIIFIIQFIFGGLGFVVFFALWQSIKNKFYKETRKTGITFFSNIIVSFYIVTIVISLSLVTTFQAMEKGPLKGNDVMKIIFNTLSARSAGFSTVNIQEYFGWGSKYLLTIMMWIGCAPLSTGGGIKITTFVIMLWAIVGKTDSRNNLYFFGKNFATKDVLFVYKITIFSLILIMGGTITANLAINANGGNINFIDSFFYSSSAMGNAGLSTFRMIKGKAISLKIVSIIIMLIGQIGIAQTIQSNETTKIASKSKPYLVSQKIIF